MDNSKDANGTIDDNDPSRSRTASGQAARRVVEIRLMSDDESHQELSAERSPYFQTHEPLATYASNRETVLHREQDANTLEETHVIRNEGIQDMYFTEEHWSSEIKSFVTTTPPKFVQVIKAYRVLSTDRLTLVVEVSSDPPAIFEWSANDRLVAQDPRRFVVRHGVNVTTLSVEGPEQGVYSCSARNPAGVSKSYGYVTVDSGKTHKLSVTSEAEPASSETSERLSQKPPKFLNQVPHLTLKPGAEAIIDVEVESAGAVRFTWYVNGRQINAGADGVEFFHPRPTRCVVLFQFPESGQYTCVAQNENGASKSSGFVEIEKDSSSQTHLHLLQSQQSRALAPQPPGAPRGGRTITRTTVQTIRYVRRSSSLPRSQPSEGEMQAETSARYLRKSETPERVSQQFVPQAPVFVTGLPPEIIVSPNEKLVLSTEVRAAPPAEIRWDVDGVDVQRSKQYNVLNEHNRSTLVVHPPVTGGRYNVTCANEVGKASFQTLVRTAHTERSVTQTTHERPELDFVEEATTVVKTQIEKEELLEGESDSDESVETIRMSPIIAAQAAAGDPRRIVVVRRGSREQALYGTEVADGSEVLSPTSAGFPQRPQVAASLPTEVLVPGGEPLIVEFKVHANPVADIRWYFKNFELKSSPQVEFHVAPNYSRLIHRNPQEGVYRVVATNAQGAIAHEIRVFTEVDLEQAHIVSDERRHPFARRPSADQPRQPTFRLIRRSSVPTNDELPKPPKIVSGFLPLQHIREHHPLTLEATADAIPEAAFEWRINNFQIKPSPKVTIDSPQPNSSRATFHDPSEGRYEVIARNNLGQDSLLTKVVIDYVTPEPATGPAVQKAKPPVFVQALPERIELTPADRTVDFVVVVHGDVPGGFRWLENGQELLVGSGIEIVSEGFQSTLKMTRQPSRAAEIAVEFTNRDGVIHSKSAVNVVQPAALPPSPPRSPPKSPTKRSPPKSPTKAAPVKAKPPRFSETLTSPELFGGDNLALKVSIHEDTTPCIFEWYLDGELVPEECIQSDAYQSSLEITNVGAGMEGHVLVIARNVHGVAESSTHFVAQQAPEKEVKVFEDAMLRQEHRESTAEAYASDTIVADQQKSEVEVTRTAEDFTETTNIQKKEETYSLLVKVAETLAQSLVAKIFIEAYDDTLRRLRPQGGTTEESSDGDSIVFESTTDALAPSFEIMRETYNISEGQNVTIHTSIRGEPCHTVEWYHDGTRVEESRNLKIITTGGHTQLVMNSVTIDQAGEYQCRAENNYGCGQYVCVLRINKPGEEGKSVYVSDLEKVENVDQSVNTNVTMRKKEDRSKISAILASISADQNQYSLKETDEEQESSAYYSVAEKLSSSIAVTSTSETITSEYQDALAPEQEETNEQAPPTPTLPAAPAPLEQPAEQPADEALVAEPSARQPPPSPTKISLPESAITISPPSREEEESSRLQLPKKPTLTSESANIEIVRPEPEGVYQMTLSEPELFAEHADFAATVRVVGPDGTRVSVSPLQRGDAEDQGLGEETVGVVITIEQPSAAFKRDLTIVESETDSVNLLTEGDFYQRSAEVIQPNVIRLTDNRVDAEMMEGHVTASVMRNVQTVVALEGEPSREERTAQIQANDSASANLPTVQAVHTVAVTLPLPVEAQDESTTLLRPELRPADAETLVEIIRPEYKFTYELRIEEPQLYLAIADIVGQQVTNERIINVVEEIAKDSMEGGVEVRVQQPSVLRTFVSYQWILSRTETDEQAHNVWRLQRRDVSELQPLRADVNVNVDLQNVTAEGGTAAATRLTAPSPNLITQVLTELQHQTTPSRSTTTVTDIMITAPEEPLPEEPPRTDDTSQLITTEISEHGQKPVFRKHLEDSTLIIGQSGQLKCIVSGIPPPEVAWFVDGDQIVENEQTYELIYEDGVSVLRFRKVAEEDEGEYVCEAYNIHGQASTKCFARVTEISGQAHQIAEEGDRSGSMPRLNDNFILRKIKRLHKDDRASPQEKRDSQLSSISASQLSDPESDKWYYLRPGDPKAPVQATESFIIHKYFDAEYITHSFSIPSDYESAAMHTSLYDSALLGPMDRLDQVPTPVVDQEVREIMEHPVIEIERISHATVQERIRIKVSDATPSDPNPGLVQPVRLRKTQSQPSKKTGDDDKSPDQSLVESYIESLFNLENLLPVHTRRQDRRGLDRVQAATMPRQGAKQRISVRRNPPPRKLSEPYLLRENSMCQAARVVEITQEWALQRDPDEGIADAFFSPLLLQSVMNLSSGGGSNRLSLLTASQLTVSSAVQRSTERVQPVQKANRESQTTPGVYQNHRVHQEEREPSYLNGTYQPQPTANVQSVHAQQRSQYEQHPQMIQSDILTEANEMREKARLLAEAIERRERGQHGSTLVEHDQEEKPPPPPPHRVPPSQNGFGKQPGLTPTMQGLVEAPPTARQSNEQDQTEPPVVHITDDDFRLLRQTVKEVQRDLDEAQFYRRNMTQEARDIERAIMDISERIAEQEPVSKAQAEANAEILKCRLAEMILNLPSDQSAGESYKILQKPVQALEKQLKDIEKLFIEEEEKSVKEELKQIARLTPVELKDDKIKKKQLQLEHRSHNVARMTPLVTVVRHKLEALGDAVNDGVQQSSGRSTPYHDRLTIHSLLLKINEEIGNIHRLCKEDSDLDGVNAVVQVLSVVCSHIDTILETLYGWGRESPSNLANTNVDLKKEQEDERVQTFVIEHRLDPNTSGFVYAKAPRARASLRTPTSELTASTHSQLGTRPPPPPHSSKPSRQMVSSGSQPTSSSSQPTPKEVIVEVPHPAFHGSPPRVVELPATAPNTSSKTHMDVSVNLRRRGAHQHAAFALPIRSVNMHMSQYMCGDEQSVQMLCEESDVGTDTDSAFMRGTARTFLHTLDVPMADDVSDTTSFMSDDPSIPILKVSYDPSDHVVPADPHTRSAKKENKLMLAPTSALSSLLLPKVDQEDDESSYSENIPILFRKMSSNSSPPDMRETAILSDEDDSSLMQVYNIRNNFSETFTLKATRRHYRVQAVVYPELRAEIGATFLGDDFQVDIERMSQRGRDSVLMLTGEFCRSQAYISGDGGGLNDWDEEASDEDEPTFQEDYVRLTVSVNAKSQKDDILVHLEEIIWDDVQASVPPSSVIPPAMTGSMESRGSVPFNVIVSQKHNDQISSSHASSQRSLSQSEREMFSQSQQTLDIPTYVIRLGSTASITCELNNFVERTVPIEWYRGRTHIHMRPGKYDRISHDLLEVLIVSNVERENGDLYNIKFNGELFPVAYLIVEEGGLEGPEGELEAVNGNARANGTAPSAFLTPPQTMFAMEGQTAILSCQRADPHLNVMWYKEQDPLEENSRIRFETTDSGWYRAIIEDVNATDRGTYYACLEDCSTSVTLVVEEHINEKEVQVSDANTDDEELSDYLVPPGSTATIACELESTEHGRELRWQRNGRNLEVNNNDKLEHVINGKKHYLIIHNADPSDSGVYSVSINNTRFKVAQITISEGPQSLQGSRVKKISNTSINS